MPANTRAAPTRDEDAARSSYATGDTEASKAAHSTPDRPAPEAGHVKAGDYIKSMIFGGLDGIITTLAIVCAARGADLTSDVVIMMGIANLVADGISMGMGDFLSERAEQDFIRAERAREMWEFENYREGELSEMMELYEASGIETADARTILDVMCKYKDFFVDHMMVVELGLLPPEEDGSDKALVKGMVTFGSFVVFGTVPLLSFLLVRLGLVSASSTFRISCCAAAACMFGMGMLKGQLARQPMLRSGVFMLLNGTVASTAAYITGWAMEECLRGWGVDSGGTPLPGGAGEL